MHPTKTNGDLKVKKIIAVVLATMALTGCVNKEEVYICESSKLTVTENKIIATDKNGTLILDKESENVYGAITPVGRVTITRNGNKFTTSASIFSATEECKIAEGK